MLQQHDVRCEENRRWRRAADRRVRCISGRRLQPRNGQRPTKHANYSTARSGESSRLLVQLVGRSESVDSAHFTTPFLSLLLPRRRDSVLTPHARAVACAAKKPIVSGRV